MIRRLPVPLLFSFIALAFAACGGAQKAPPPPVMPVKAVAAAEKSVPQVIEVTGTVEPEASAAIRSQAGGVVLAVHFKEGQEVKAGDLLVTLDSRPYQAALSEALAHLARDRAQAANAAAQSRRSAELVAKEYVTREQADASQANADAQQSVVAGDQSAVAAARLQLDYCNIRAPIAGRTGGLLVKVGNLIKANDDKPLLVINRIHPIRVVFAVPQGRLSELKRRAAAGALTVTARPGDDPGAPDSSGTLSFIDNAVDTASGTEARPGVKDPEKLEAFALAVASTFVTPEPEPAEPEPAEPATPTTDIVAALTAVLDDLGAAHHRPFSRA